MKNCCIAPAFCFAALFTQAQTQKSYLYRLPSKPSSGKSMILDTVIQRWNERGVPDNGMPNAIKIKPTPPVYMGNNGMGSDIYRSQLDNMAILMPDSSFNSSMPVQKPGGPKIYMRPIPKDSLATPEKRWRN